MSSKINRFKNYELFCAIIKKFNECKSTETQIKKIQLLFAIDGDKSAKEIKKNFLTIFKPETETSEDDETKKYKRAKELVALCTEENKNFWIDSLVLAIQHNKCQKLLFQDGRAFGEEEYPLSTGPDTLSISVCEEDERRRNTREYYVQENYMELFATKEDFVLPTTKELVPSMKTIVTWFEEKYHFNVAIALMRIFQNAVSQSSKSISGAEYEAHTAIALEKFCVITERQKKDKNFKSIEYDFITKLLGKRIGWSSKRTERERYKQTCHDINDLEVEAMFHVSNGTDMSKNKMKYILQYEKHFIVVSKEEYEKYKYLQSNDRVIPSDKLTLEHLEKLLTKYDI